MTWHDAFSRKARAYWTPERTQSLIGDKPLLLLPGEAAPLLRMLGLLQRDASMSPAAVRKFRQINHLLLLLEPPLNDLMPCRIIDAGCGSSYLTMLLAWHFRRAHVVGVDRNAALLRKCEKRAAVLGLHNVSHVTSPIATCAEQADAVVSLHACDTASDDAIALGVRTGASLIAVVPCCQAELAAKANGGALAAAWASPHLRRLLGSTLTDTLRMLLLRAAGYDVTAMEFVPTEHTPKNTLLRARKRRAPDAAAADEYVKMREILGAGIALEMLLPAEVRAMLTPSHGE